MIVRTSTYTFSDGWMTHLGTKTALGWGIFWGEFCRESTKCGNWKRLQMLNELRFGGHGFSANLVPGPPQANQDHKNGWEIPADKALGSKSETYDPLKHRVAWLQADIKYWEPGEFDPKCDPPVVRGELPKKHWYAKRIEFTSGQYERNAQNQWVIARPEKRLVPDFTLNEQALPVPNWSLAKVPPINTGDRSEFQMKAVRHKILTKDDSKLVFEANAGWKYLDKRRKEKPFSDSEDVINYLVDVADTHNPPYIDKLIDTFEKLFRKSNPKVIRIDG